MQTREKDRKVAKNCVFLVFCGSGGSKSRLPKAAGAEPSGQLRNDKLHFIVARSSRFGSQKAQDTSRPHFGSSNVHKGYVVVVRSTFGSENVEKCTQRQLQLQRQLPLHYTPTTSTTTTVTATTTSTALQLQRQRQLPLHYNYKHTTRHHTTLHAAVVGEVTTATTPKAQLQPPSGPSVHSLCHPCITTTHLSYSCLSFKLSPPPCAVLVVWWA